MSPALVEAGGVALAVDDRGQGPAVVLVHGIAAARSIWMETIDRLGHDVRTIAYDRRGYGGSGAPDPYTATTLGEQADDLEAVLETLGVADGIVVGHGLGAIIALELLRRGGGYARAGVVIEPPMLWLSPLGPEIVGEMREAIAAGAQAGGPGGAVEAYLEYVAGPEALSRYGPVRAEAAREDARAFAADLAAAPSWQATRGELRRIGAPIELIGGTRSPGVVREVIAALGRLLPAARMVDLETGHLPMLEQSSAIADAVRRLLPT